MEKLEDKMNDLRTHPDLLKALISRLNNWRYDRPPDDSPHWDPAILPALHKQDLLGWKNLLECLPVKQWKPIQQAYYDTHHYDRSANTWMTQLLQQLHTLAWSQWKHRNDILHEVEQPLLKAALKQLNDEITAEHMKGPADLPDCDSKHFNLPLFALLNRSTPFKQSWLLNVQAARQAQQRRLQLAQEALTLTQSRSHVLNWIRTGLLR